MIQLGGRGTAIVPAARVALMLTDGVSLEERIGMEARHKLGCDNPMCCRPSHLEWGTPEENRWDWVFQHGSMYRKRRDEPAHDA